MDYYCNQCSKSFSSEDNLKKHQNRHDKMKTLRCGLCSATFKDLGAMRAHLFTHGKRKQYQCSACSLKCRHPSALRTHQKIHTNDRQVTCKEKSCKMSFITKGIMQSHWRASHLKMKTCKCLICGHIASSLGNLKVSCSPLNMRFIRSVYTLFQLFWTSLSFGEECMPVNLGLYIILTMLTERPSVKVSDTARGTRENGKILSYSNVTIFLLCVF